MGVASDGGGKVSHLMMMHFRMGGGDTKCERDGENTHVNLLLLLVVKAECAGNKTETTKGYSRSSRRRVAGQFFFGCNQARSVLQIVSIRN